MTTDTSTQMESDRNGLLALKKVVKHFDISGGLLDRLRFEKGKLRHQRTTVKAVNNVSFTIAPGETFSVVGESGCGKSTLARTTLGIYPPNSGKILYRGDAHRQQERTADAALSPQHADDFSGSLCISEPAQNRHADLGRTGGIS
jgi:ABC-type oligopeptide transport system ATPase subunit